MKPNFALSLSFEGIRLLHRAAGGWRRVGEVPVTSADLNGDLEALRKAAAKLDSAPLRTKLIIPDDQIKYLSIDTGEVDAEARRDAARAALDGATPYSVDTLVFDICEEGGTTHVAAVARETLAEAEAFASEHHFHPVSFVAAPMDQGFLGEPWFGTAAHARAILPAGDPVVADGVRVVVIGDVEDAADAADEAADDPDADTDQPEDDTLPDVALADADDATPGPALRFEPVDSDLNDDDLGDEDDAEEATTPPTLGFASRRNTPVAPAPLGGVTRDASDLTTPPARVAHSPGKAPLAPPASFAESLTTTPEFAARTEEPAPPPRSGGGFLSRRSAPAQVAVAGAPGAQAEAQRMTIFGARDGSQTGGKPRFLGLILTAILILFLAGVAALASVYLDDRIAGLFQRDRTLASTLPDDAEATLAEDVGATTHVEPETDTAEGIAVASLNEDLADGLSEEDAAVLDALRDPLPAPQAPEELDAAALEARYAVTGIWPKAPQVPDAPPLIPLEDFYLTGIDPVSPALDAVALPRADTLQTDAALPEVSNPAAPGTNFARDDNGFIIPTPGGTLSPDGYTVVLGPPPLKPPLTPTRFAEDPTTADPNSLLAGVRPQARPGDLVEQNERATLGGLLRTELATYRPRLRPLAPQELLETPTPQTVPDEAIEEALTAAVLPPVDPVLRPTVRPRNFDRIVTRTQRQQNRGSTVNTDTRVASVAPRTVTPSIPSSASVTREATVRDAINLRRVNLIGVYGTPSDRRALVRLGNGRYQKVQVGDRFDGGRVSAIGDSELRYQKGGRNLVLKMPSG
ncbi:hypothetical protein [uncultured Tateyamaria sp.]|uniref:hypothetical protein n=1 Tax=Tateyamaria sp. 1078 TaxID=3417464 RepID=UPI00261BAFA0|nr:hypothetical protein [uncultured Tateyamaria sp.]